MAGLKITELPELGTTPAAGDWLVVVDVSDTSESAQGTTKKVLTSDAIPARVESVTGDSVDLADPLNPIINKPYKSIVCLISQAGVADPTMIILQNDFSAGINVIRDSAAGTYALRKGTSDVVFTEDKTFVLGTSGGSTYDDCFIIARRETNSTVRFYNYGNGGGLQDEFTNMSLEIRVYP